MILMWKWYWLTSWEEEGKYCENFNHSTMLFSYGGDFTAGEEKNINDNENVLTKWQAWGVSHRHCPLLLFPHTRYLLPSSTLLFFMPFCLCMHVYLWFNAACVHCAREPPDASRGYVPRFLWHLFAVALLTLFVMTGDDAIALRRGIAAAYVSIRHADVAVKDQYFLSLVCTGAAILVRMKVVRRPLVTSTPSTLSVLFCARARQHGTCVNAQHVRLLRRRVLIICLVPPWRMVHITFPRHCYVGNGEKADRRPIFVQLYTWYSSFLAGRVPAGLTIVIANVVICRNRRTIDWLCD